MNIITKKNIIKIIVSMLIIFFIFNITSNSAQNLTPKSTLLLPTVVVKDQPIINSSVTINRVTSTGPGWIAIHNDSGGLPGPIIGYTHVHHGINSGVIINITESSQTPLMFAMLHIDNTTGGQLGVYDGAIDAPVRDSEGKIITPSFNVLSPSSPVVLVDDQPIVDNKVLISLTNLGANGWIVIHNQTSSSTFGPGIGHSFLPKGINRNIIVDINSSYATSELYAMIHFDNGTLLVYDGPQVDNAVGVTSESTNPTFYTASPEVIGETETSTSGTTLTSGFSPTQLHIIFSIISGFLLILIGIINVIRNYQNRINHVFFGFFAFIAFYQIFDAILVYIGTSADNFTINLIRDLSIASLILGLFCGAVTALIIFYGEDLVFFPRNVLIGTIIILVMLILGIFGDNVEVNSEGSGAYGASGPHVDTIRSIFGWLGVTGSFVLFSTVIIVTLISIYHKTDEKLKERLIRLLSGFILSISFLFLFDVAFIFDFIKNGFLGDNILHFIMHEVIVVGVLLVFSAFWTPLKQDPDNDQ